MDFSLPTKTYDYTIGVSNFTNKSCVVFSGYKLGEFFAGESLGSKVLASFTGSLAIEALDYLHIFKEQYGSGQPMNIACTLFPVCVASALLAMHLR